MPQISQPQISQPRRTRRTPFSPGVEAAGVSCYSVYNHMLLPAAFRGFEADYLHLKQYVQIWDVACERQVEVRGKDATRLMQLLTPRDISKIDDDQCYYLPVVDQNGGMLNDPVAIKHAEDRWWISIADSDFLFWVKGIAYGMGLEVQVFEPDVSPLAVQGPKADDLMAKVFGDSIREIKFFRHKIYDFRGTPMLIARSGYSKQGGFEIYVDGTHNGMPLWQTLFEAGEESNVQAGCPSVIDRIEGGLLSYGNDMTIDNTPYECNLGKYCHPEHIDCIGKDALIAAREPKRMIRPLSILGKAIASPKEAWSLSKNGKPVGQLTSAAWSPDANTNVAIGMVNAEHWDAGNILNVHTPSGIRQVEVQARFWS